jgi:hypothetical protein
MLVFESYFLISHITAVLSHKNLSRPLRRPQIFTAIQLLKFATIEESGREGGHLAILLLHRAEGSSVANQPKILQNNTKPAIEKNCLQRKIGGRMAAILWENRDGTLCAKI